jgi:hypothetical protein
MIKQMTLKKRRQKTHSKLLSEEQHFINNIRKKINQNKLIATKADKGNTLVILHKEDYKNKIEEFTTQNNFTKLPHDITNKQQKHKG